MKKIIRIIKSQCHIRMCNHIYDYQLASYSVNILLLAGKVTMATIVLSSKSNHNIMYLYKGPWL